MFKDIKFYSGLITPNERTIFVFGSNPDGIHRSGSAKVAMEQFGAVFGQGEGLQGQSYALPTKDINKTRGTKWHIPNKLVADEVLKWYENNNGIGKYEECTIYRSISVSTIKESIRKMYAVAHENPKKFFKVAYTNKPNEMTLNGYIGAEMAMMFLYADGPDNIPCNVQFSVEWKDFMYSWYNNPVIYEEPPYNG